MPARNRPAKRVLNRWSDDLDKGVLLCVQYACAEAGLKIPWSRVAALMGPTFTEGSIVQHLAKLRNLMAQHGIPVPPAVKRGMVTKEPSKIYGSAGNKVVEPIPPMFPGSPTAKREDEGEDKSSLYEKPKRAKKEATKAAAPAKKESTASKGKGKAKGKGRRRNAKDEDDDNEPVPELFDSDDEYPPPRKRRNNTGSKKKDAAREELATILEEAISPAVEDTKVDDDIAVKVEEEELGGPARRTRGIKRDYSIMAAPSDDEAEVDDEAEAEEEAPESPEYMNNDVEADFGGIADDGMDEASSEVSTVVLDRGQQVVADVPYGQIIPTMEGLPTTSTFGDFNPPNHIGVGIINHNSYSAPQLGYSGAAIMGTIPQAYPQFPSMSMYGSSTDSSRNNSICPDMMYSTLPSMSDDEFLTAHTGFCHGNTGDVISEEDMMNTTANADIFWGNGDYELDDA
ncbi:uncharacterized protein Z519_06770 [Cladophialophora bantiana CBS 173.52]|uniref:Myb-like domain-containing protein n=1 Tax=Cladophialophora bantiana (strain ATCC 10958 / CBS 173.52 / CDC B-1940 / NIH 8579) TaxID=1442370 RepID=A0A0D2ESS5_CLAB1|nr:uncharacterized protein Z519_06770 [Cladophialophora bantiana CBS 173.52]KIW92921.1 hypothetical protein Z519_06770 [Cladophialophora bantiana CBS 173.52]